MAALHKTLWLLLALLKMATSFVSEEFLQQAVKEFNRNFLVVHASASKRTNLYKTVPSLIKKSDSLWNVSASVQHDLNVFQLYPNTADVLLEIFQDREEGESSMWLLNISSFDTFQDALATIQGEAYKRGQIQLQFVFFLPVSRRNNFL